MNGKRIVGSWMVRDAHERGVPAVPYLLLTPLLGSAAPLLHLLRRPAGAPDPVIGTAVPSAVRVG